MTGPQADQKTYNPVLEAISALQELERIQNTVSLSTGETVQALAGLAVGWSLLASVTGGQTINLGTEPPPAPPNPLESQAKEAFGG